jgi:hypothetical protein
VSEAHYTGRIIGAIVIALYTGSHFFRYRRCNGIVMSNSQNPKKQAAMCSAMKILLSMLEPFFDGCD